MTYGNTYSSKPEPNKQNNTSDSTKTLVEILCKEYGYNREGYDNYELEVKFDIQNPNTKRFFDITDKIIVPTPYIMDKILPESSSTHSCYAYMKNSPELAFTQVNKHNNSSSGYSMKLKIKGKEEYESVENIIILKRSEKHIENATGNQAIDMIKEMYTDKNVPIAYIGSFEKNSKEFFIYDNNNGRIFVVALNICKSGQKNLVQAELEYYGRVNILTKVRTEEVFTEMSKLSKILIEQMANTEYIITNSIITKFDWLMNKRGV
ncbi:MAG: hypothetical protein ACP5N1_05585 [Candidatus Woesearchaeota archaeon]